MKIRRYCKFIACMAVGSGAALLFTFAEAQTAGIENPSAVGNGIPESATVAAEEVAEPVAIDPVVVKESVVTDPPVAEGPATVTGESSEPVAADSAVAEPQPVQPEKPRYPRDDVRWIQQRLQELGYYNGRIDGAYGRITREAIKAYQVDQELEQDGRPTPELRDFMWRNGG